MSKHGPERGLHLISSILKMIKPIPRKQKLAGSAATPEAQLRGSPVSSKELSQLLRPSLGTVLRRGPRVCPEARTESKRLAQSCPAGRCLPGRVTTRSRGVTDFTGRLLHTGGPPPHFGTGGTLGPDHLPDRGRGRAEVNHGSETAHKLHIGALG